MNLKLDMAVLKSTAVMIISRGNFIITNAVIGVLLARWLGPNEYGIYAFILSIVTLLSLPSSIGIPNLLLREVSIEKTRNNISAMKGLFIWSSVTVFSLSMLIILMSLLLYIFFFKDKFDPEHVRVFFMALPLIPILSLSNTFCSYIRGLNFTKASQISSFFRQESILLLLLVTYFIYKDKINSFDAYFINVTCSFLALVVALYVLIRTVQKGTFNVKSSYRIKYWFYCTVPFAVVYGMQIINNRADSLMLGFLDTSEAVAYYDIAMRGAELLLFFQIALNMTIAPLISKYYAEGNYKELSTLITKTVRILALISIPIFIVMMYFGDVFIEILFGDVYLFGIFAFKILLLSHLINILTGPCDLILNMCGHEKLTMVGVGIAATVNIILNSILIPKYGLSGACFATLVSTITWNLLLMYFVRDKLGLDSSFVGKDVFHEK